MPRSTSRFIAGPIGARRSRDIPAMTSALGPSAAPAVTAGNARSAPADTMADRTSNFLDRIVMSASSLPASGAPAQATGDHPSGCWSMSGESALRASARATTVVVQRPYVLWDGPPLLLRQRYAAGLTLRERSGRWRLRCLGLILARTAAASQGWTERVESSCGDASLGRASSVLPERCRPA